MKVHIVSLQRTGSKSLYHAIHAAIPKPLQFENGDQLGEFLHCWSEYGFKFGPYASHPFDQQSEIVFRTNPKFVGYQGTNFTPVKAQGKLLWKPTEYKETLTYQDVARRLSMLKTSVSIVVKTQMASLLEEVCLIDRITLRDDILRYSPFTHTIFLTPDDLERWFCSNYLCDHSGVFVQCKSQEEAAARFKESPVTIPSEYLELLSSRYKRHVKMSQDYQGIHLHTSELRTNDPKIANYLNGYLRSMLGLDVYVQQEAEFSAFNYETMIANYDEVRNAANQLR